MEITRVPRLLVVGFLLLATATIAMPSLCAAQRLPAIGSDDGLWGEVLNAFLMVSLNESGGLKDDIVTSSMIADGAVHSEDIGFDAIDDGAQVAGGSLSGLDISDGSISGDDIADGSITSEDIQEGTISSDEIGNGAIQDVDIAYDQITSEHLADGTVRTDDLATECVTLEKMSADSITSSQIIDGSVTTDDIADGTVTADDLAFDAVGSSQIADDAVGAADLADGAVDSDKVADGSLNGDDIDPDAILIVAEVNATRTRITPTAVTASCASGSCTATAACDPGQAVLFGLASVSSTGCITDPSQCDRYCVPGAASCAATSAGSAASVYLLCARIA